MRSSNDHRKPFRKKNYGNRVDILGNPVTEKYKATCDNCGKECLVPFKPSNGKPVYCNDCFVSARDDSSTRRRPNNSNYHASDYMDKRMYTATCDECGKSCEVPFKPSQNKPVYCSDCFEKRDNTNKNSQRGNSDSLAKQLDEINQKLDKLMQLLRPTD